MVKISNSSLPDTRNGFSSNGPANNGIPSTHPPNRQTFASSTQSSAFCTRLSEDEKAEKLSDIKKKLR